MKTLSYRIQGSSVNGICTFCCETCPTGLDDPADGRRIYPPGVHAWRMQCEHDDSTYTETTESLHCALTTANVRCVIGLSVTARTFRELPLLPDHQRTTSKDDDVYLQTRARKGFSCVLPLEASYIGSDFNLLQSILRASKIPSSMVLSKLAQGLLLHVSSNTPQTLSHGACPGWYRQTPSPTRLEKQSNCTPLTLIPVAVAIPTQGTGDGKRPEASHHSF